MFKKIKNNKIKAIIFLILALIPTIIGIWYIYPYLNNKAIYESILKVENSNDEVDYSIAEAIVVENRLDEVLVFVVYKGPNEESFKKSGIGYFVTLYKNYNFSFKIKQEYPWESQNYSFAELKTKIVKDKPYIKNTDPDNLRMPCIIGYCEQTILSNEESNKKQDNAFLNSYFNGPKIGEINGRADLKVADFKKLSKNMIQRKVYDLIGYPGLRGDDNLNISKGPEDHYKLINDKVYNFVILSYDYLSMGSKEADKPKLQKVILVKYDRSWEELDIE